MKKRYFALGAALLAGGVLVAGFGAFLKTRLPEERAFLYEEHSFIALPFALMADGQLDDVLRSINEVQDTTPVDASTTGTEADTTTEITEQTTTASETTVAEETTVPEETPVPEETTEAPTEPATAPVDTQETTAAPETDPPATDPVVTDPPYTEPIDVYPVVPDPIVGTEYFDNALFIGDSRMCGMRDYARLGQADYFCDVGLSIFSMWYTECGDYDRFPEYLEELLTREKYGKIYVALGINECGYAVSHFQSEYQNMVARLRQLQPDAVIVLQGIMTVTRGYAYDRYYFQPDHIGMLNNFISSLADWNKVFYIDPNPVFADSEGYLLTSISRDGCHLYAGDHWLWAQWIMSCPPPV